MMPFNFLFPRIIARFLFWRSRGRIDHESDAEPLRLFPPPGNDHGKTGLLEDRPVLAEEASRLVRFQIEAAGVGFKEHRLDLWIEHGGPAQLSQEQLLGSLDPMSRRATSRTGQASPSGQRQGNDWIVTRLPRRRSTSPPTFSMVGMSASRSAR